MIIVGLQDWVLMLFKLQKPQQSIRFVFRCDRWSTKSGDG